MHVVITPENFMQLSLVVSLIRASPRVLYHPGNWGWLVPRMRVPKVRRRGSEPSSNFPRGRAGTDRTLDRRQGIPEWRDPAAPSGLLQALYVESAVIAVR